jgi:hypothetical protein
MELVKVDMLLIRRMLEIPTNLNEFTFLYRGYTYRDNFTLADLGDAIGLQAHSLRDIHITYSSRIFPPRISPLADSGIVPSVAADKMCIGSFQDFHALTALSLPFDMLFGPDPSTATSISQLLPATLEFLSLKRCMFRKPDNSRTWGTNQVLQALNTSIRDLSAVCPSLYFLWIGCLSYRDFETLEQTWIKKPDSQYRKKHTQSGETPNQSPNVGSRLGFDLEWTGSDYDDLDENNVEIQWDDEEEDSVGTHLAL